ncbi:MAG: GAF domain-containing protein [Chloroflexi bacterium]|nr:GAF domain-containing protein [Chloroflexota bacterium]
MKTPDLNSFDTPRPKFRLFSFFSNLRVGIKLSTLIAISVVSLGTFAAFAFYTMSTVQVNGPLYKQLTQNQELVADILPPPAYIIESYLTTSLLLEAAKEGDTASVDSLIEKIPALQNEYKERHTYWVETLTSEEIANNDIKQALLVDSYLPAQDFFEVVNNQLIPAIRADKLQEADKIFDEILTLDYESHRSAIDRAVLLQHVEIQKKETDIQSLINRSITFLGTLIMAAVLITIILGFFIVRSVVTPVSHLAQTADQVAKGNLEVYADITSTDEIGMLARSFNSMIAQLKDILSGLEQRVADRTKALDTSTEVSRRLSTILDRKELVTEVVNQVRDAFDYYHTQIYFFDDIRENLVMAGGTGEAGRMMLAQSHKLAKGRGLVGRAAESREPILITDTSQSREWLPNPLLPETKSEVAIPIAIGDQVLGVLDVQHNVVDGLKHEDIDALQAIANQVAIAAQNAQSYTEIQRSQVLLSDALKIARLANWEYDAEKDLFTFNDQFYSIFRTTVEKVGGYKISSADYARNFVHPDDGALVGGEIQKVMESKERHLHTTLEHRIIFSDGEIGYITVNINVERDKDGKIIRWYGANQDVTERRRLEELNRKRAAQQEAINLITQKIQGTTTVEAALQIAARELGHSLGMRQTLVTLDPKVLTDKHESN